MYILDYDRVYYIVMEKVVNDEIVYVYVCIVNCDVKKWILLWLVKDV